MPESEDKKPVYKIGGMPLEKCAKKIVKHALDEHDSIVQNKGGKIKKTPLCYYNNVKEALICAFAGVSPERAAIMAGYKTAKSFKKLINAIHDDDKKKSRRLFSYYWHKARASLDAVVHKNILNSLLEGNVALSRDLQKALNEELNEKKKIETTVNKTEHYILELRNLPDDELDRKLELKENRVKKLEEQNRIVELKKNGSGSYETKTEQD